MDNLNFVCFHREAFYYRRNGCGWQLKYPWSRAWFSERNGYDKPKIRLFGFRLFRLEPTGEKSGKS